jgi:hypothetical protein
MGCGWRPAEPAVEIPARAGILLACASPIMLI